MVCWILCVLLCVALAVFVIAQELNSNDPCETTTQSLSYIFEKMVLRTWLRYPAHYGYEVRTSTFDNPWRSSLSTNDRIRWDHYWTKKEEARWAQEELEAMEEAKAQAAWEAMSTSEKIGQWLIGKDRGGYKVSSRRVFYCVTAPISITIGVPVILTAILGGAFAILWLLVNGFSGMGIIW